MLDKSLEEDNKSERIPESNTLSKSNIVVNMVNITDVIDSQDMNVATSCIALIGIEPFAFKNLTLEGIKRNIKISKDSDGNIYINKMKAKFLDIGDGIKVLIILKEEKE